MAASIKPKLTTAERKAKYVKAWTEHVQELQSTNGPRCQRCGEEPTLIVGTEESWRCAHCGYYAANDCAVDWDIE